MPVQVVLSFAQSLIAPVLTATLLSMLAYDPDFRLRRDQARYCASLTCSSQSTTLPVKRFRNRNVCHRCGRRRAVPMLLARREPDDVPRPDLLDRPALALRETAAGRHNQGLSQRMRVPGRARAGLERDAGAADARRIGRPCR